MREHRHGLAFGWLIIMVMTLALFALTYALLLGPAGRLLDIGTQQTSSSTIASGRDMARARARRRGTRPHRAGDLRERATGAITMVRRFLKAPFVLLSTLMLLAVLFGPLSAAIEPLFDAFRSFDAVQSSDTPTGPSDIDRIAEVLFVQGPIVILASAVLFLILAALRFEGVLK